MRPITLDAQSEANMRLSCLERAAGDCESAAGSGNLDTAKVIDRAKAYFEFVTDSGRPAAVPRIAGRKKR